MATIAFFPWAYVDEPVVVGPLRLLPYCRGALPGDMPPHAAQADIDGIFSAYAYHPGSEVTRGALLELGDWEAGMDVSDEQVSQMLAARHLIAFAALAERRLFSAGWGYSNFDTYSLVVQRYQPGETDTFSFVTRRRDGGTHQMWGTEEFAFHRPRHVVNSTRIASDTGLLESLLNLPKAYSHVVEAIEEFNLANTDSPDVPLHVEAVMCKSALERLLRVGVKKKELIAAINDRLSGVVPVQYDGPSTQAWFNRWQHSKSLLNAWIEDFCAVRGSAAHGKEKSAFVWGYRQHLAFLSTLFPLLVKKVLADDRLFRLSEVDQEHLRHLQGYLVHDPFQHDHYSERGHPWQAVATRARSALWAKALYPNLP